MTFKAGSGAGLAHDYSIFATIDGTVHFEHETRDKKRIRIEALAGE
jgi:ribosomal protein L27